MENLPQDHLSGMNLQIDPETRQHLNDSSKWSRFISITIFVFCGIILVISILAGSTIMRAFDTLTSKGDNVFSNFPTAALVAIVFFVILLLVAVYYFLYNYAVKVKAALLNEDAAVFNKGLRSLKTFFIITTIMSIISLLNTIFTLFR